MGNDDLKLWWLVRDYNGKFVNWRYVFCASRGHTVGSRIRAEFERRYGYRPTGVMRVCPTGRSWLVGPVEGE